MYLLAQSSIDLACAQERAFDYAANLEHFPRWFPGVLALTAADALPFTAPGKQYRETVAVPLRGERQVSIRVIESAPPHRLVTEGSLATLLPRMELEVARLGQASCRVSWRMMSRNDQGWARWLALPLARRVMTKHAHLALRQLKAILEGAAS